MAVAPSAPGSGSIARGHDLGAPTRSDPGVPYLVMELLQGKTLADLIKQEAPLPAARALDIARQTLRGLAFAHGKGNALLSRHGTSWVEI